VVNHEELTLLWRALIPLRHGTESGIISLREEPTEALKDRMNSGYSSRFLDCSLLSKKHRKHAFGAHSPPALRSVHGNSDWVAIFASRGP
jgi:hypothetical protein